MEGISSKPKAEMTEETEEEKIDIENHFLPVISAKYHSFYE